MFKLMRWTLWMAALGAAGFAYGPPLTARLVTDTMDPFKARQAEEALFRRRRRVMAVGARAEDLDYHAGGTLGRMARAAFPVTAVHCCRPGRAQQLTSGGWDAGGGWEAGSMSQQENGADHELHGFETVLGLDLPADGLLYNQEELVEQLGAAFRKVRPEVIFTFDPVEPLLPGFISDDHQAIGTACLALAREVVPTPHVYLFATRTPTVAVDISQEIGMKARAAGSHLNPALPGRLPLMALRVRELARAQGKAVGYRYAESFRHVDPTRREGNAEDIARERAATERS